MDRNKSSSCDNYVSEQRNIKYSSVWSLESIAAVKVVGELWKQPDLILDLLAHTVKFGNSSGNCSNCESGANFHQMEEKVLEKLSRLLLPLQSKEIAFNMIRPVGLEILRFMDPSQRECHGVNYLGHASAIFLTMYGTIDKIKTLNWHLNYVISADIYESACIYCSDHIFEVWRCLPRNTQNVFQNRKYRKYSSHLIAYWTCVLSGELLKLFRMIIPSDYDNIYHVHHSVYKNMFALSVSEGNVLAVKYFWPKLTLNEIRNNIERWTRIAIRKRNRGSKFANYQETNGHTDVLCFLLSQMDYEEQRKIFSKYGEVVLDALFYDWPWQDYLLPTIRVMWDYLKDSSYLDLLSNVSREIKEGRTTEKIIRNLFCESPIHLKKSFVQDVTLGAFVLRKLVHVQDAITIQQILRYSTTEQTLYFMGALVRPSKEIFQLMYTGKLYLLSRLSGVDWLKYFIIRTHGNNLCHNWICNGDWQAVEKFIAWGFSSQSLVAHFKRKTLDRVRLMASLVRQGDYELVDKFMIWCFNSEKGISQFKKKLLYGELKLDGYFLGILELLCDDCDWNVYEKLINWCCKSDTDIRKFKIHLSQYDKMEFIMRRVICSAYNFEFAEKLLVWCFDSYEDVKRFKEKLSISKIGGMKMIGNLVKNCEADSEHSNNWELVKELLKWLHPLEKSVVTEMKRKFEQNALSHFGKTRAEPMYSVQCKKRVLFHLLDSFAQDQDDSNIENYSDGDDYDVTSLFGEVIQDDSDDDSNCSINTEVANVLCNIMDISTDTSSDESSDKFDFEVMNEEDISVSMDVG